MNLFTRLFSSLNDAAVEYLVAGGIAVNLYGIQRSTGDVDVVLRLNDENVCKFVEVVGRLLLKPKVPVRLEEFRDGGKREKWIREKGMTVFTLYDSKKPFFQVDVFAEEPFAFVEVYARRKIFQVEGVEIPVVPIMDLIAMKAQAGRPQDQADVFYLRGILGEWENEG
jgi:hypothetical protein